MISGRLFVWQCPMFQLNERALANRGTAPAPTPPRFGDAPAALACGGIVSLIAASRRLAGWKRAACWRRLAWRD